MCYSTKTTQATDKESLKMKFMTLFVYIKHTLGSFYKIGHSTPIEHSTTCDSRIHMNCIKTHFVYFSLVGVNKLIMFTLLLYKVCMLPIHWTTIANCNKNSVKPDKYHKTFISTTHVLLSLETTCMECNIWEALAMNWKRMSVYASGEYAHDNEAQKHITNMNIYCMYVHI